MKALLRQSYGGLCLQNRAALQVCPKSRAFLQIPEDHYISCLVGFGKPEFQFPRGVQRSDALKIHRILGENRQELL